MTLFGDRLVIIHAFAKINLFLAILDKRPDGFHEIDTVMSPVSLYDTLRIRSSSEQIRLTGRFDLPVHYRPAETLNSGGFWGEGNLVYRAAKLLLDTSGKEVGCQIELIKRIPSAAGLGGASSDAAATLIGLNRVWNLKYSYETLHRLASQLGSDVPFFLQTKFARCTGRGEIVQPISQNLRLPIMICKPPSGLSTAKVYANCEPETALRDGSRMIQSLNCANARKIGLELHNGLENSAKSLNPWIGRISYQFSQLGSLGHQMSGSGSSYFGLFPNRAVAQRAAKVIQTRLPNTFVFVGSALTPRRY